MLIAGIDLETTGLSVTEDRIIEIGAVLWDTDRRLPVDMMSVLVNPGVPIRQEITDITGITNEDLGQWGRRSELVIAEFLTFSLKAEALVAHNGHGFDRPLLENECARHEYDPPQQPWIDTMLDVEYPEHVKTRKLSYLAAEHGFLNPFEHRALTDVLTMLQVLAQYDINKVLELSQEPKVVAVALVKKPWEDRAPEGGKETDRARARGYRFDGGRKLWLKTIRKSQWEKEQDHGEFPVKLLE